MQQLKFWEEFMLVGTTGHIWLNRLLTYYYAGEYTKFYEQMDACQIIFDVFSIFVVHGYKNRLELRLSKGKV